MYLPISVESSWIREHILDVTIDRGSVIEARWANGTHNILTDVYQQIISNFSPPLPSLFKPVATKGQIKNINFGQNYAIIRTRCKCHSVGCSTQYVIYLLCSRCDITVPIFQLGYLYTVPITFQWAYFMCNKHPQGVIVGQRSRCTNINQNNENDTKIRSSNTIFTTWI